MVSAYNFTQALATFAANLKNNPELANTIQGYAAVKMQVNNKGMLTVTKAETFGNEAAVLEGKLKDAENELKQAKKKIITQEKEIENLTAKLKEAENIPTYTTEEPKPEEVETTKKKENQIEDS